MGEPFWPLGLGLKRGWQAIMDTCYAVDNLYNTEAFRVRKGKSPEEWTWDDHHEALAEQVSQNFELCNRLKICDELGKGAYDEKGPVMSQLKKFNKDAEIPIMEVEVDPWTRYDTLAKEDGDSWKLKMKDPSWVHPRVQKELNKDEHYKKNGMSKTGEFKYKGKDILEIDGKATPGKPKPGAAAPAPLKRPVKRKPSVIKDAPAGGLGGLVAANKAEVTQKAQETQETLHKAVLDSSILDSVVKKRGEEADSKEGRNTAKRRSSVADAKNIADILNKAPIKAYEGNAEDGMDNVAHSAWNRATGKGMTPAQQAELAHCQNMIAAMEKSLKTYRQAEKDLLSGNK